MSTEEKVAKWIFKVSFLDDEEETWNSMMLEEVTERIRKILEEEQYRTIGPAIAE